MANKNNTASTDDNMASRAPIGPCGYIYLYPTADFPIKEASLLGNRYASSDVLSLPLLKGLTVEEDFHFNVKAVHKQLDINTLSVKVTTFHREVIVFHNAELFDPIFHGPGLDALCEESRTLFGFSKFTPREHLKENTDLQKIFKERLDLKNVIGAVIVSEGFKERLYSGKLFPIPSEQTSETIGGYMIRKCPLYDSDLIGMRGVEPFYSEAVSKYLHDTTFTCIAQAIRVKNVQAVIDALEDQFLNDYYKIPKLDGNKEFSNQLPRADANILKIIDCAATELAVSYGISFIEAPQEPSPLLDYTTWSIFENCPNMEDRLAALNAWNAKQAIHLNTQILATNSILYLTRVSKTNSKTPGECSGFNSFFLQHGLENLADATHTETGELCFGGSQASLLSGNSYTIYHLAYSASLSPHNLARHCYYLQFYPSQRATSSSNCSISHYVGTTATSNLCQLCSGECPASCLNTLFQRLKDRFPPVISSQRRDPYVITGVASQYNDLEILGNFASFREKDEDHGQADPSQRYTYWQMIQSLTEKLESLGISEGDDGNIISDMASFLKTFKEVDVIVENEALKFFNAMVRSNVNFRETIKHAHHVVQYNCNQYWQPPCSSFLLIYYKTLLTIIQDICLPSCMLYEQDNPHNGQLPSEWLRTHYQTLWTNFKGSCFDKGVLTGTEAKVTHKDHFCDFFDVDAATRGNSICTKKQVRLTRAVITIPKVIKIKNRIIFSNSTGSETIQSSFLKTNQKGNYIVTGPFMKFLNMYHRILFPTTKMSALFTWHNYFKTKSIPVTEHVSKELVSEFVNYIDTNSKYYDETNVLDVVPDNILTYAKLKLNNVILRTSGQTQYFATTIQALSPRLSKVEATDYPHVLGNLPVTNTESYLQEVKGKEVTMVQTTVKDSVSLMGRLRPIVTLPIIVNKYNGINGNNGIFHCGNFGYFIGRGVDRNLISDSFNRKGTQNIGMRKRHIFMTPFTGNLLKKSVQPLQVSYEIELVKKAILGILTDCTNIDPCQGVALELVRHLGPACATLTEDDLQFYLGEYCAVTDDIMNYLKILEEHEAWTVSDATTVLDQATCDEVPELITIESTIDASCTDVAVSLPTAPLAGKKRKLNSLISELDI
ncbi:major DNA-binding protein [Saguinine gammaherpesvirus 1]|uniref:Major DNA-binding protein n=1 Tax=Saguinine gammaherpesvirus 1 TaxID=2169901 RepID=A0A9Q8QWU5_9GAMA|nr:major DNA-binding protein [Saguinine gammaherpesvirus 1]